MAKLLTNVAARDPKTGELKVLLAGTEAPAWAKIDASRLDAPALPDASGGYTKLKAEELKMLIAARNAERDPELAIVPDSTKKDDLIAALEVDDQVAAASHDVEDNTDGDVPAAPQLTPADGGA